MIDPSKITYDQIPYVIGLIFSLVSVSFIIAGGIVNETMGNSEWASIFAAFVMGAFFAFAALRTLSLDYLVKFKRLASMIMAGIIIVFMGF